MIALAPKDGQLFTRENLAAVEELTKQSWQIPYSIRVGLAAQGTRVFGVFPGHIETDTAKMLIWKKARPT